ncbi:hypothetical protein PRIPAC_89329 [Pristionchus pacificus]|nr:hypothetical protein PRIPAC_89329 [Pristionchus pacificus]
MFLPIDQECSLHLSDDIKEDVIGVVGNRDRSLIALITLSSVHIYNAQPSVLLCTYRQPEPELAEKGEFVRAYWQFDSIALAVTTKKTHLLIFSVTLDIDERSYCLKESDEREQIRSRLRLSKDGLPSVFLQLNVVVNTTSPISCAAPNRDELLICGSNGFVHHLQWNGKFDNSPSNCSSFQLSKIPFAHDQLQSKPAFLSDHSSVFIRDITFAPLTGGYSIVLSDGRAALLTSNDHKFLPNTLLGVWASHLKDAVVTDTNHRFRSLLFGCTNGDIVAYHVDDLTGALHQTFRVSLTIRNGPELSGRLGHVRTLRVLPQNGAIAVVWDSGGRGSRHAKSFPDASISSSLGPSTSTATSSPSSTALTPLPPVCAVFSPMGAQWWCSLEGREEYRNDSEDPATYTSIDWGPEGYQIWLGGSNGASLLQMTRSAAFANPYMEHSNRIVLIGAQRIYISPLRSREVLAASPQSVWSAIDLRPEYLHANWPIRFASLDREYGRTLVVAGSTGLSFCALSNQRWKIFGNESQERELHVTGGLFVWRGLMVGACAETGIKMYPIETRLDERFASTKETDARIIMSNMKGDILVTMDVESRLLMYTLHRVDREGDREGFPRAAIERTAEIRIGELVPHIACLVSVHLTVLTYDKAASAIFVPGVDTVLLNISGRLYTLTPKAVTRDDGAGGEDEENRFQLNQPATIASFVEQVWHDRAVERNTKEDEDTTSPLRNALWINCGARGSHVWLPLLSGRTRSGTLSMSSGANNLTGHHHDSFLSRRIMIPFGMEINPALIASSDCIATGVESTPAVYSPSLTLYTPHRNSEVFIHHLLRQLLKRNLGMFALDLAESFRYLPYFTHSLELLLHNVLEEEATSAEPIPDPLLPRVVAFIQEFPEFLKTIAHCARKTELALWPSLFEVTGKATDLFEVCLRDGELDTAASYLIILQNSESAAVSLEQSAHLLREALTSCSWQLARDLVRFAKSIDAEDMESSPARSPPPSMGRRPSRGTKGAGAADELVLARFQAAGKVGRLRHSHSVSDAPGKDGSTREGGISRKDSASKRVLKTQSSDLSPSSPHSPTSNSSMTNAMLDRMNRLLLDHARGLLEEYCVRDLGCLCSHLEMDTSALLASLSVSPQSSTSPSPLGIVDFSLALQRVHSQFEWPYPVPSSRVVEQLAKKFAGIKSSASTACLSDTFSDMFNPPTPSSIKSKKISRDENSLAFTPIDEVPTDVDNGSTSGEVIAMMERMIGPNGYNNGGRDYRSGSPSASSMRTSSGIVTMDDSSSINGTIAGSLEPLLGPNEAVKGNEVREAQLRYMVGAFSEIAAMDWVFLLCVVLRDATVARTSLSVAAGRRAGAAAMQRLRAGCKQLIEWAGQNCLGYVHILQVFDGHLSILCEALGPVNQAPAPSEHAAPKPTVSAQSKPVVAAAQSASAAAYVLRSRALRDAFGSPGGAVRSTDIGSSGVRQERPVGRARSRSVDRGTERNGEMMQQLRLGDDAVSNLAVQEGSDCSIM